MTPFTYQPHPFLTGIMHPYQRQPPPPAFFSLLTHNSHTRVLLSAAVSASTWRKISSARNSLSRFCKKSGHPYSLPLKKNVLRAYISWSLVQDKLSPNTVKEYVSSLKTCYVLSDLSTAAFEDQMIGYLLRGAENLGLRAPIPSKRRAMLLPLMRILVDKISKSDLPHCTKSAMTCLASVAFFGCLRLGELVASNRFAFDPTCTLLVDDINFSDSMVTLHIRSPKIQHNRGDFVDLFRYEEVPTLCPLLALRSHKNVMLTLGKWKAGLPVFQTSPNGFFTGNLFNTTLKSLLGETLDWDKHVISGHSFRAGIPSSVQRSGSSVSEIKRWGRWRSAAVDKYRRQNTAENRVTFAKITAML